MASIYSEAGTIYKPAIVKWGFTSDSENTTQTAFNDSYYKTSCASGTAICSSFTEELEKFIGTPLNSNVDRIKSTVSDYIRINQANSAWVRFGYSNDVTDTNTSYHWYSGTTDGFKITSDFTTNSLEIEFNDAVDSNGNVLISNWEKRAKIKSNLIIRTKSRVNLIHNAPENEQIAIESLREVISETEFRKYLKYGFVLVKAKSGKTYQVFRNKSHTKVWLGGELIEEICVRIKNYKIPPTDNVIALKTMLETNEEECRRLANVYKMKAA